MANEVEVKTKIYIRHDTEENWTSINPVLQEGELGYSIKTSQNDEGNTVTEYILKIGDGKSTWTELSSNHVYYNKEDIDNLLGKIESGESDLGTRVDALENKVGNEASDGKEASGLIADVSKLQTEVETENTGLLAVVGDENNGLVKNVSTLQTEVEDETYGLLAVVGKEASETEEATGLIKDVRTLEDTVNGTAEEEYKDGLTSKLSTAEDTIASQGENISKLQEEVEGTETTDGLLKEVEGSEEDGSDGLLSRVSTIETTLNGEGEKQGLVADVSELQSSLSDLTDYVGTAKTDEKEATGLTKQVEDNASSIDKINSTIEGLNYPETEVAGDYVTSVKQEKGQISVTKSSFDTEINENSTDTTIATSKAIYTLVNEVQTSLQTEIGNLVNLSIEVVDELPDVEEAKDNIIYLVKCEDETSQHSENDTYDEYVLVEKDGEKAFEKIGNTDIDLSNYVTDGDLEEAINNAKTTLEEGANSIKEELEGQISSLSQAEDANATSIESINTVIGAGDNYSTETDKTLIERISTLENTTATQETSISSINTTISSINETLNGNDEKNGLVKDVENNTSSIEALDKQINGDSTDEEDKGIAGQVESLESSVEEINTSLKEYAKTEDVNNTIKELGSAKVSSDGKYVSGVEVKESTEEEIANGASKYVLGIEEKDLSTDYYTKDDVDTKLSAKQDSLSFDTEPKENGTNPVTSGGIYTAISGFITESDLESKFYIEDGILYYGVKE